MIRFKYNVNKINNLYNFEINKSATINNPQNNSIIFLKKKSDELLKNLENVSNSLLILPENIDGKLFEKKNLVIYDKNPRYRYAKILTDILRKNEKKYKIFFKDGYYFGENVEIGNNVIIENYVKIGNNVSIGDNTIIRAGVRIRDNVKIGENCFIKENCVIGSEGFGIEKDENGNNFRIPHVGGVIIENDVEIGSLTTVCSGTIEPTIVKEFTKIDDHVHIGHNAIIKRNVIIVAGTVVGGSAEIDEESWLGMNSSIKNGLKIGKNVITGMGSRILKNVADEQVMTNERAETLENVKSFTKYKMEVLKKLINGVEKYF